MRQAFKAFTQFKYALYIFGFLILITAAVSGRPELRDLPELVIFFGLIFFAELLPVNGPSIMSELTMTMPAVLALFVSHG
ncbi:MAG: hypothetical protein QME62_04380, partial [Armatimonadota bacterium]|nr:hypothetical protein [Armatimonadota bacterium]